MLTAVNKQIKLIKSFYFLTTSRPKIIGFMKKRFLAYKETTKFNEIHNLDKLIIY